MYPEAIREFRELEVLFPGFRKVCHMCLGTALRNTGDLKGGGEKSSTLQPRWTPFDPEPLIYLGERSWRTKKKLRCRPWISIKKQKTAG